MPRYGKPTAEVSQTIKRMMDQYHQPLVLAEVTIDALMAMPNLDKHGEPTGPALKLHGYECAAVVKINSYKLRCQRHADAEITINADKWDMLTDAERDALIDHELTHIELKTDADDALIADDLGRPKLGLRLHDHQYGWFDSIVERHGAHSIEGQQAAKFVAGEYHQNWLPYMEADEEDDSKHASPKLAKVG